MAEKKPEFLTEKEIEDVEKLTIRWIYQAVLDFGMEAYEIFLKSPDSVKDIVDYKKARYIILPDQTVRQALFIDSKAEKENRTATIQMSQTSMWVKQKRYGTEINQKGFLPEISEYGDKNYLTTTCLIHFKYEDDLSGIHHLREVTIAAIPNGKLQDKYNPSTEDGIWLAGRNAPTLGEDFRVRVSFSKLTEKAIWRVQKIFYNHEGKICEGLWKS
jgi:hypothetical protein